MVDISSPSGRQRDDKVKFTVWTLEGRCAFEFNDLGLCVFLMYFNNRPDRTLPDREYPAAGSEIIR
jgi:hypothetical protein